MVSVSYTTALCTSEWAGFIVRMKMPSDDDGRTKATNGQQAGDRSVGCGFGLGNVLLSVELY